MNSSIEFRRTDSNDPALPPLIEQLDQHLYGIYGDRMEFFSLFNGFECIKHVMIVFADGQPVGCGSIKAYEPGVIELKRMYVAPSVRGQGVGSQLVDQLAAWATELGFQRMILETGHEMTDAVALYQKTGFSKMDNYEPYVGVEESWCFRRELG